MTAALNLVAYLVFTLFLTAQPTGNDRDVRRLIEQYNVCTAAKDVDGIMQLYHRQIDYPGLDPNSMRKAIEASLKTHKEPARMEVVDVFNHMQTSAAKVRYVENTTGATEGFGLVVMRPQEGRLRICGLYTLVGPNEFDPKTRVYKSQKGKFMLELRVPAGWTCCDTSSLLGGLVPSSVLVLAPDLRSSVIMGLVKMPVRLGGNDLAISQKAIEADTAMEQRFSKVYSVLDQGPTQLAGMQGFKQITEFKVSDGLEARRRMRLYLSEDPMLYFFICDAMPPGAFEALLPQFEAIITSLRVATLKEGISTQEALAAGQATGGVIGRVYTSVEYNCFIAAPSGWQISTSPNPAHLVEMQYQKGRSLARLIGVKGLGQDTTLQEVFARRLDSVKQLVEDFNEVSRREITLAGVPAIESVQTFKVSGLGLFHVKEVTIVRDGNYYLILCQCIEPDEFAILERDFDLIIKSFGFVQ